MRKKRAQGTRSRGKRRAIGKLVIFGVGLIGGSFALALKRKNARLDALSASAAVAPICCAARRLGIIDEIATDSRRR